MNETANGNLESLRTELGNPEATKDDIIEYFKKQAYAELAAKLGLPPSDSPEEAFWAIDQVTQYQKLQGLMKELGVFREGADATWALPAYYDRLGRNKLEEKLGLPSTSAGLALLDDFKVEAAWKAIEATLQ